MSGIDRLARRWWAGDLGAAGTALDIALAPAEAAYRLGTAIRNSAYDRGTLSRKEAELPVISVGNIAVGGTGKTPFTSWLAQHLEARGERPAIVHGGYADDEPQLHRAWTPHIPVIVNRDRARAAQDAHAAGASVVVLDDAFQHRRLHRDLDIVLVSVERWSDDARLLPRGPWREPVTALKRAGLIVCVRRTPVPDAALGVAASVRASSDRPVARAHLHAAVWQQNDAPSRAPDGPAVLVAGLADPALFAANVVAAGASAALELMFPDHHDYDERDVERIRTAAAGHPIITSAKDAVKLRGRIDGAQLWVLTQELIIEEGADLIDDALDRVLR